MPKYFSNTNKNYKSIFLKYIKVIFGHFIGEKAFEEFKL